VERLGSEHYRLGSLFGALVVRVFAASIGTPVEGKIGRYTAEWTLENQGHPHDRQKPERCQRSGRAGLNRALVAAEGGSRLPSCDAAPRGGCRPDGRGVAGYPRRVGKRETTALSLARRGEMDETYARHASVIFAQKK
jgi:hypothetical protein